MRKASQVSFHDYRMRSGRGGPRKGSGRKPSGRNCDPKRRREVFTAWKPVHVTLRVREGLATTRGIYEISCRLINPVTGSMYSEDLNDFQVL